MNICIEVCDKSLMPEYAHAGDAGMDVRAAEDIEIKPGETKIVKTGIKVAMPRGLMMDVRPRSGLSLKTPLRVANAPGTVDSGYRDEVGVIITNTSLPYTVTETEGTPVFKKNDAVYDLSEKGNKSGSYIIHKGDRIAQIIFLKYEEVTIVEGNVSDYEGDRGGGFGHSGIK